MQLSSYSETQRLRACDCDLFGRWMPSAILITMQETAGTHSALLGLDRESMNEMGLAWILSRVKVEMKRIPRVNETIRISTYPTPQKHLFYPRIHVFMDEAGNEIGYANSLWVLMDLQTRRITKSEKVSELLPENRDMPVPVGIPATVRALQSETEKAVLFPDYTDFDINQHVNNTKYLNWCCNKIGMARLKECCIQSFDVNYNAEVLPGMQVQTELCVQNDAFTFMGYKDNSVLFGISGHLQTCEN